MLAPWYASVSSISCSAENGLGVKPVWDDAAATADMDRRLGCSVDDEGENRLMKCAPETGERESPIFVHAYVQKISGSIPCLSVAVPLPGRVRLSQLGMTYMMSHAWGMLIRYYPTLRAGPRSSTVAKTTCCGRASTVRSSISRPPIPT